MTFRTLMSIPSLCASLLAVVLAACGGQDLGPVQTDTPAGTAAAEPADAGARTRTGLYLSVAQARQRADVLQIDVGCCGPEAVEQAVGIAWGLQAAHDLPRQTPVLVRGDDLRLAAAAANRLADGGLTHVWLVTP